MPEGVGYIVHEGGGPPSAGQIRDSGGAGVLWKRPDGSVFRVMGPAEMYQATPEQVEYANAPPPTVGEQTEGVEAAAPPAAGATPERTGPIKERFTSGKARREEMQRAGTEASVQRYEAEQRRREADPMAGLSLPERGEATRLMETEGVTMEEAAERIRQQRAAAEEQAVALEE